MLFTGDDEYDLLVLALGLLINCLEHSQNNQIRMRTIVLSELVRPTSKHKEDHLTASFSSHHFVLEDALTECLLLRLYIAPLPINHFIE